MAQSQTVRSGSTDEDAAAITLPAGHLKDVDTRSVDAPAESFPYSVNPGGGASDGPAGPGGQVADGR